MFISGVRGKTKEKCSGTTGVMEFRKGWIIWGEDSVLHINMAISDAVKDELPIETEKDIHSKVRSVNRNRKRVGEIRKTNSQEV